MKSTGIPFVPGSSIKGLLRDARLLAQPARSFRGTFAWTTPLLLTFAKRDLDELDLFIPSITGRGTQLAQGSCCAHWFARFERDLLNRCRYPSVAALARYIVKYMRHDNYDMRTGKWRCDDPSRRIQIAQRSAVTVH